ncbi:Helix-turn-helix domain-containing protein [Micromonospora echinospora]|uniref:Helix-turn-helix domain-containing protein n=1 Tax=Micromonospora echinospora TaxID=1877 RepID=A0A1C4WZ47_MICEC|nr:helix-turn-helix domain-containing protein [Micromonospora echinospora]SCF01469.1 Helix-turn-helix domain-containing protein [Micromonospora echinospora]
MTKLTKRADDTGRQPLRVMGTAEIAEYLGVSRQWVEVLSKRRDFPEPSATLKAGRIWRTEDVERWAAEHRPRPESDEYDGSE